MVKKKLMMLVSLMLVLSVFLAACSKDKEKVEGVEKEKPDSEKIEEVENTEELSFPVDVSNKDAVLEDGELVYALVTDDPFKGTLSPVFYDDTHDATILSFFSESLLAGDGDYLITNDGAATYDISNENKTITIKIKDGVKWHDGEPVKASDLLYAYEIIGHPDYTASGYVFPTNNISGMTAYHEGKADTISGITVSDDDRTIAITFEAPSPSILSGVATDPVPRHYLGDVTKGEITIEEIEGSDKIRTKPIGFGPYKVKKVIPGEAVQYERFDDYWRGKPNLKSIVLKVVNSATILEALKKGEVDIAGFPTDQYLNAKDVDQFELLGKIGFTYTYIGFNLGEWDKKNKTSIMNPKSKSADKRIRQAMWHAMNNEVVGKEMYHGLRVPATTLIPPALGFHDAENKGRSFDPEKAKELLDEAGLIDVNNDGFREDADGNELIINFLSMSGGEVAEPLAKWYMQNWNDVGLKVQLLDGRLHEMQAFYDMIDTDRPDIDIFMGAWVAGTDPDPSDIYGRESFNNFSRYTSEKNDELLKAGTSEKAFDVEYRRDIYNQWQEMMVEEVSLAPTLYRHDLKAVNKRVTNYSIDPGSPNSDIWMWGVTK
ncbi:oligopeptide ABC transporter substrate-binding protein [Sporosarcina limicola]|uniref:Peptide/nickel transport system substrate-binding protein n=1 Tax=Sporosarcina limicola TaxID=34101 RepID=A0A927MKM9_9BACL|nr:oligopeptide ABC transporter substrate-binding protein [Sporosarcina limicola]MBE1553299.1 peptide/nickel transport system substrate-binding protein [Sporosarcina limicola]